MTQDYLKSYIKYCPLTGLTIHIKTRSNVHVGDIAGSLNKNGHVQIGLNGKLYYLHRLIWLYMTGRETTLQIDHIDGNGANNKWTNLREVSAQENSLNQVCHRAGQLKGVTYNTRYNKWVARSPRDKITNKQKHLGYFNTMEEAHKAYSEFIKEIK